MIVTGQINYVDRHALDATTYYIIPPAGIPIDNVVIDAHEMTITDLRTVRARFRSSSIATISCGSPCEHAD